MNRRVNPVKIYVIGRPSFDANEIERFLADRALEWARTDNATPSEEIVEACGRVCYLSFTKDVDKIRYPNHKYIKNLIQKGHESVLEHAVWTFILDGVSRSFTHQLVRHRVGFSFSQLSQQYHDERDTTFVVPTLLKENAKSYQLWKRTTESCRRAYKEIVAELSNINNDSPEKLRWARSVARSLLPNATESPIAVTANARALRHFFELRGAILGDYEMRFASAAIFDAVSSDAPTLFADFKRKVDDDGYPILIKRPFDVSNSNS